MDVWLWIPFAVCFGLCWVSLAATMDNRWRLDKIAFRMMTIATAAGSCIFGTCFLLTLYKFLKTCIL